MFVSLVTLGGGLTTVNLCLQLMLASQRASVCCAEAAAAAAAAAAAEMARKCARPRDPCPAGVNVF